MNDLLKKVFNRLFTPYFVLRDKMIERSFGQLSEEDKFTLIYRSAYWKGLYGGSLSGAGSNLDSTAKIRQNLLWFIDKYDIHSMLDLPCGDWYWMSMLDLTKVSYLGGDIVEDLIKDNQRKFTKSGCKFMKINLIEDDLPKIDMVFVRDCLVHLEEDQILRAIENIVRSGSTYLVTTTFPGVAENRKPEVKDKWRPLNMCLPPFSFPMPLEVLDDSWSAIPQYVGKRMGVWRISDLVVHQTALTSITAK